MLKTIQFLLVPAVFLCTANAYADNKSQPNRPNNRNDEAEIRAAQAKLEDAKREATDANKDATEARTRVVKVRSDLIALRRKIEDAAEGSSQLKQAHERVDKAKAALKPIIDPILATVHQSPEYIAAVKQRDELRAKLQAAPQGIAPIRSALALQVADAERELRNLESAAIGKSPAAGKAQQALSDAEGKLRKALEEADNALSKNQQYAGAKRDLEKAEQQAESAAAKAAAKQKAVAAAQNKVQAEIAEERKEDQREREQQQNKNKNKNNKKK
jgi:colicin import membrane protein